MNKQVEIKKQVAGAASMCWMVLRSHFPSPCRVRAYSTAATVVLVCLFKAGPLLQILRLRPAHDHLSVHSCLIKHVAVPVTNHLHCLQILQEEVYAQELAEWDKKIAERTNELVSNCRSPGNGMVWHCVTRGNSEPYVNECALQLEKPCH